MAGGELRRSYTQMDFSLNRVRPQMMFPQQPLPVRDPRRRYSAMPANNRKHPTLDIYRPPSVRMEGAMAASTRALNVNAPEFKMNHLQSSRSTSSVMMNGYRMMAPQGFGARGGVAPAMVPLQMSKSSGNVLHAAQPAVNPQVAPRAVHFQDSMAVPPPPKASTLKRSKSLSATDTLKAASAVKASGSELGTFSTDVQRDLQQAIQDPNLVSGRALMALAPQIVERATSDRRYAVAAAKVCIDIIEKEKKETFLESLLNTCQAVYQDRDRLLRPPVANRRYRPYMTFLNEMYVQLKRSQLQLRTQYDGVPPQLLLLTLLSKCFIDCLQVKPLNNIEIESIFFILTSIGKDLEQNLPKVMEEIVFCLRDAFLAPSPGQVKRTLLQLIELHASKWQMPASAVTYYCGAR